MTRKSIIAQAATLLLAGLIFLQPLTARAAAIDLEDSGTSLPATLQNEAQILSSQLTVKVDADIKRPENETYPIARLTKKNIDAETAANWLSVLADGREIYQFRALDDYSKEELASELQRLCQGGVVSPRTARMENYQPTSQQEAIDFLEQYYTNAPQTPDYTPYHPGDPVLNQAFEFSSDYDVCTVTLANGGWAFRYERYDMMAPQGMVTSIGGALNAGTTLTVEQAQEIAEQFVSNMGLEGFTVDAAGLIPYPDQEIGTETCYDELPKCYVFYFTHNISGMNETYTDQSYIDLCIPNGQQEYIEVTVGDEGIISAFCPTYPTDVEILEENIQIMDFSSIMDVFYTQIDANGCWQDREDDDIIETRTVCIDEITLGAMRFVDDESGDCLLLPVWSFFGTVTTQYQEGKGDLSQLNENNEFTERGYRQCLLTLSAIDGSVIDRDFPLLTDQD